MALPRHRNHRLDGRHRNISISCRHCLVGRGRPANRAVLHARTQRRACRAVKLAERMASRPVLVTFNGKSFDWPLLETRYRMTRTIKPSAPHTHLDFLHPARNLWRIRLGSVRLAELEKHVLGWNRGADLISE